MNDIPPLYPPSPTPSSKKAAVLDLKMIQELTGGDISLLDELVTLYLEDVRERIKEFEERLEAQDYAVAQRQIHTIKGSSATIGAQRMEQHAKSIELVLRNEPPPYDFTEARKELHKRFQEVLDWVKHHNTVR